MSTPDGPEAGEVPSPPLLRIVRGAPEGADVAVELAALVAVLAARGGDAAPPAPHAPTRWAAPGTLLRAPIDASRDGWWASGLPR